MMTVNGPDRFPVLWPFKRKRAEGLVEARCPYYIPWALVAAHERQAIRNHDHDLKTLARHGGLSPMELVAVLTDRCWSELERSDEKGVAKLLELVHAFTSDEAKKA